MAETFFLEEITGDDVNPYEAVVLASKEARRVNQARLMVGAQGNMKATTLALRRLANKKVRLSYGNEVDQKAGEATHGGSKREKGAAGK
ncbi:MAG: hypothetical protein O2954_20190 [bacterium]|nr:hypothetical protein [bacterium]